VTPLLTTKPLKVLPETSNVPPALIVVPLAVPPLNSSIVPPLATTVLDKTAR
jgi:hypothetical protein